MLLSWTSIGIDYKILENIMSRLFTFGCSFTQYWRWPTWADALGQDANHFENWGLCGAGNSYLLWSLIECNQLNKLNANDEVWIMWTNTSREDRYVDGRWLEGGNVYWSAGSTLPAEYVKKFADERGYLIRDLANIAAAKQILDSTGCKYKFLSMVNLAKTNKETGHGNNPNNDNVNTNDVLDFYNDIVDMIGPSVQDTLFNGNWWTTRPGIPDNFNSSQRDFHPTPLEHVEYLDLVAPGRLSQSSKDWMTKWHWHAKDKTQEWREPNRPERL
jgi:hypothetical protein